MLGSECEISVNTGMNWLTSVNLCDTIELTDVNQLDERRIT